MTWKSYNLDQKAQKLVLIYRDKKGVIGQSHKMRSTVAYGLERFSGEHLRLLSKKNDDDQQKGKYWQATWKEFTQIMKNAGVQLPEIPTNNDTAQLQDYASRLWNLSIDDQRVCLTVLTQFCDSLVWWTQRYKKAGDNDEE
ncbi:hypothetical protein FHK94_17025 [Cylindrospermopsis raciborskii CS-506_D]|uniref:CRISPR type III-B/RAMP module-associated protein Cmr5 n=2 Tax=Cylindrospermopsis raciborskii TaxID=77022 RepID=A0A838WN81_9CYAN|nr:hypothetical protein [Cylindrospermopsis raciborskii]BAZ88936.1 hypothetical protein NIES932_04030 [Raphidiopsis curvata NIES-932]MBA4446816.1 hypothetical protein [Cylindrospermopsis raciborskii CS-506_C]MBA4451049.1 hypothetical protein [Cylindrospermopsis raciborskii CS-506_D]MBA4457652.1 hypothetical protein [Cylindrospermopsis raciborskii CS-506_B]MBA4467026.1 hypothetical protein [Cylindrospermopsis raciborskii CS-506_A]